jgi:membrane protease YdiL (CAAX protease family)
VTGRLLWARFTLATAISVALLLMLSPPRPETRVPALAALMAGICTGFILFAIVARERPFLPALLSGLAPRCAILALAAANEEVLWRRVVLGELLGSGSVAALAGSTLGFALAHRARPGLHLATGLTFGGLYLGTGALGACIAAHLAYNLCLLTLRERVRLHGELVR